jgi:hypothetical protein
MYEVQLATFSVTNNGSDSTPLPQQERAVTSSSGVNATISVRLQSATNELRQIQDLLASESELDPRILSDFRDAVNRVRNTVWGLEQYANSKTMETDPNTVLTVLAAERIRVAYQLCKLVQGDLANPETQFQKGQLLQLRDATQELARRLGEVSAIIVEDFRLLSPAPAAERT